MSYTLSYKGLAKEAKYARAYKDAVFYNHSGVMVVSAYFRQDWLSATTLRHRKVAIVQAHFYAAFAGIHGVPVRAILRYALVKNN